MSSGSRRGGKPGTADGVIWRVTVVSNTATESSSRNGRTGEEGIETVHLTQHAPMPISVSARGYRRGNAMHGVCGGEQANRTIPQEVVTCTYDSPDPAAGSDLRGGGPRCVVHTTAGRGGISGTFPVVGNAGSGGDLAGRNVTVDLHHVPIF